MGLINSSLRNNIHPPGMEMQPPKTVCSYPYGGIMMTIMMIIVLIIITHAVLSSHEMHLSLYTCTYRVLTPQQLVYNYLHRLTWVQS